MTRKPGSSADVNWSLQDCLSQTHAALHQLTVAPTFRQGSKVQHGLLAFILGYISISHPRDEVCFAKVNHHQMFPYKQPKSQLHRYWWKTQSFHCFCRHKTWLSLFTYEAQGLVSPQAAGKAGPRARALADASCYPCPCCAVGCREQKGHWYDWHSAP